MCDFGFARPHNELIKVRVGTFGYTAPEIEIVIDKKNPDLRQFNGVSADIFALGVLLFIMAFGAPFFSQKPVCYNDYQLFMANEPSVFFNENFESRGASAEPNKSNKELIGMIKWMLQSDPESRP